MHEGLSGEMMAVLHRFKKIHMMSISDKLSRGEFFALNMIHKGQTKNPERGGVYVSEIAECLKIAPSAVSRMLRNLSERGFIDRKVDENDRRNTYVSLTPEGERVREEVAQKMNEMTENVLDKMGHEDTKKLIKLINKLANLVEEEFQTDIKAKEGKKHI